MTDDLRQRIFSLSEERRALAERLLGDSGTRVSNLSLNQRGMWFLDQLVPESPLYSVPWSCRLRGSLDLAALTAALRQIVARHESLRTRFASAGDWIAQIVDPPPDFKIPQSDLRPLTGDAKRLELERLVQEFTRKPFDLRRTPLMRASLLRLDDDLHLLLIAVHHIVFDAASTAVMLLELGVLYSAFHRGESPALPEPPLQYADFAARQQRSLQEGGLEPQIAYWRDRLNGAGTIELPTDRARPPTLSHRGATVTVPLPGDLWTTVEDLARGEHVSTFMVLLAAWKALLHRYTGTEDIVVASPISVRDRPELQDLIGCFLSELPLRTRVTGGSTFRDLVRRVRETCLGAFANSEVPLETLVAELQPKRSSARSPLTQLEFTLDDVPLPEAHFPGMTLEAVEELHTGTAKLDLSWAVRRTGPDLTVSVEYSTDLFDRDRIERMVSHYLRLLEAVVVNPSTTVADLPLLTAAERHRVLTEWNDTGWADSIDHCVHELFELQAERTPAATALVAEDGTLTYRELNLRANRLAHRLGALGVGPESRVGVRLERSTAAMVAVLAILKAGGAYVPLDPSYPEDRLAFMTADAQAAPVLTRTWLEEAAATDHPDNDANPQSGVHPDNLAYVIYTSGSTGRPKGVAMPHRPLVNLIEWRRRTVGLDAPAPVLQFSPLSFDVSFVELFAAWAVGGTLVLASEEARHDPAVLLETIASAGVQQLFLPFVALQQLAHVASPADDTRIASLRHVVSTGETLRVDRSLAQLFQGGGRRRLHNEYGPSETHVVTAFTLPEAPSRWPTLPAIGRPIANTTVYVLDSAMEPVPIGVAGELYIGGVSPARGYLGQPRLTASSFLPDPFGAPGGRLYRTGDLCRWRGDGELEHLGRLDRQVKVRGFRVEPGELEAALTSHPGLVEAAVVDREQQPGDRRLVAYVVPRRAIEMPGRDELDRFLRRRLPDHLIPFAIISLPELPLTPSGKLDQGALPELDAASLGRARYVAPRTPTERLLALLWADLLGVDRVGTDDSFFDLGGRSLLLTRLVTRVRAAFGIDLPLSVVFDAQTPGELAGEISIRAGGGETADRLASQVLLSLQSQSGVSSG